MAWWAQQPSGEERQQGLGPGEGQLPHPEQGLPEPPVPKKDHNLALHTEQQQHRVLPCPCI